MLDKKAENPLDAAAKARGRKLGEAKPKSQDSNGSEMSDDELREMLRSRGFELRRARSTEGVMSNREDVPGKARLTVHMTREVVKQVKMAALETNRKESAIVEDACAAWLDANNLGDP